MNSIIKLDKYLFGLINNKWHNSFFDAIMPFIRNSMFWIPLYLFLFVFLIMNFEKNKWWWILFFSVIPIFTDFVSSDIIKNSFFRLRPCNDPSMENITRFLLNYRPQNSSFTSSHATNHFALATFIYYTLNFKIGKWANLFFVWAGLICFAQVYVGVHFPFDVIAGGLIGYSIGYIISTFFNNKFALS